jgi:hypothetical protein
VRPIIYILRKRPDKNCSERDKKNVAHKKKSRVAIFMS